MTEKEEGKKCGCSIENKSRRPGWWYVVLGVLLLASWVLFYRQLLPSARWLTLSLLRLPEGAHHTEALIFFLYDVPKVLMLLVLVVFGVGILRSYFSPEMSRKILAGKKEFLGNILAALLGIVTPFCTCSAIPLFIGFLTAGVPLGVTFSFLISSPMINEVALVLLWGLLGWKVALLYIGTGLVIAISSGWVLGRMKMEKYVEGWVYEAHVRDGVSGARTDFRDRIHYGLDSVKDIVGKVWPFLVLGIAVGAGIHGWVPEGALASIMGKDAWWSVPVAVLIGVPLYSNAAGIVPIVQALLAKGAALGTALAFMMAVIGLSLPEVVILRRILKWPLIAVFLGVVAGGIIVVGFLFNWVL